MSLAVLLGCTGWWLARGDEATVPVSGSDASDRAAEAALRAAARRWLAPAAASPEELVAPASTPASAAPVDASCPPAWRELAGQSADAIDRVFVRLRPAALSRAAALLSTSGDPFERLAGQLLASRARAPDQPPSPEAMLALVSEALASDDPRMAGLAAQLCATPSVEAPAACSSLPPGRWAAVDPDNVQPWLALAGQAQDGGDNATVREAMARAAQARQSGLVSTQLVRLAASPTLQNLSPVDRELLVIDLIGVGMGLTSAQLLDTSRLCPTGGMGAARMQQCGAVADLLVSRGQTLLEHGIGISLGRRSGWDEARVASLETEQRQMLQVFGESTLFWPEGDGPLTAAQACETYRRLQAVTDLITSDTELVLARRALERARAESAAATPAR
jgi:hypothetical protein